MQRTRHRLAATVAASLAGLTLAAAPALAGEDDDGDDEDAQVESPTVPAPVPVENAGGGSGDVSGAPVGGVATGAGGTAPQGPDAVLLGLASGALVLVATGGRLMLAARRTQP
jgi:hypothetical protein